MRRLLALAATAAAAAVSGCATAHPLPGDTRHAVPAAEAGGFVCDNAGLERFLGMKASADLAREAMRLSGARALRWAPPRSAQTMDFREDRLTIAYDDAMVVTRARCG